MKTPTVPEVILEMLFAKAITRDDARRYLSNYKYFEAKRAKIEAQYDSKWVASLHNQIYVADTREALKQYINGKPHADRAYIEHIGRVI